METIGSIIDRLVTANCKMFVEQEKLYSIRRMTFEQFKETYGNNDEKLRELHSYFHKAATLNLQRNASIDDIDKTLIGMIKTCVSGEELDNGRFVQEKCKTENI
jgi:hypothetical protein